MTSRFKARPGAPLQPVSSQIRTVTAAWVVDYQGVPLELTIRPGEVAVYAQEAGILHIRNEETGHSRTFTPKVTVTIDHDQDDPRFELEFRDPDNPRRFMPSIAIGRYLSFYSDNGLEGFTFSNKEMFETFCDFMASPIYNPFAKPIPPVTSGLCADVQTKALYYRAYRPEDETDDPDPYLGRENEYPIDEQYPWFVRFIIQIDRPVIVWDRHEKTDRALGPGQYHARITRWNKETGEPERIIVEGTSNAGDWMQEGHVDWPLLEKELSLAHARWGNVVERQPFDPKQYKPRSYNGPVVEESGAQPTKEMTPSTSYSTLDSYLGVMRKIAREGKPQPPSPSRTGVFKNPFKR